VPGFLRLIHVLVNYARRFTGVAVPDSHVRFPLATVYCFPASGNNAAWYYRVSFFVDVGEAGSGDGCFKAGKPGS
jgi:hypothetical protein